MIVGSHMYLRALEPDDIEILYTWENTMKLWKVSRSHKPISKHHLVEYIKHAHRDIQEVGQLRLMIVDKATRQRMGMVDLFDYSAIDRKAGIGILIHEAYREKGIATEALTLIENYAKTYLNLNQLYCHIHADNIASKTLFQHREFMQVGVLRDWIFSEGAFVDEILFQKVL